MLILFFLFILTFNFDAIAQMASAPNTGSSPYILEPYLGYEKGYLTQKRVPEMEVQGTNLGLRLGMKFWGIDVAFDYMTSSMKATQVDQTSDFKSTDYGFYFGYKFQQLKIYYTYFFSTKAQIQEDENPEDFTGSGSKMGLGWRLNSFCEISFELINREYSDYAGDSLNNPLQSSTGSLSIAVPIL
jgi:hypothetical protein